MEKQFTQGEWKTSSHPFLHVESEDGQWICQMSDVEMKKGIDIMSDEWDVENKRVSAEKVLNARLIATAPKLLAALELANKLLIMNNDYLNSNDFSVINSIIKQAQGK